MLSKEQIKSIGYQIQPSLMGMNNEQLRTFNDVVLELGQKQLLADLGKTDCDTLDALVRLYTSNTLSNDKKTEIYDKIIALT